MKFKMSYVEIRDVVFIISIFIIESGKGQTNTHIQVAYRVLKKEL